MKKFLSALLVSLIVSLSFTACGSDNGNQSTAEKHNPDFDDMDKNDDGIIDDTEMGDIGEDIVSGVDNIGDDIGTMAEDIVSGAEDIVSDAGDVIDDIMPDDTSFEETTR